jgi:hypothetical protein
LLEEIRMSWEQLFGPPKEKVWQHLCDEIGADFFDGGLWKRDKVQLRVADAWTITLDVFSVQHGKTRKKYTRLRVPFVTLDDFRFLIYRKGLFTDLGKLLGVQDIEVGDPEFDEAFVIQANNEAKVRALFANPQIRDLLHEQPEVRFELKDNEGRFWATFPESVDVLHFQAEGVLKDVEQLKGLFYLMTEVLRELYLQGTVSRLDSGVEL